MAWDKIGNPANTKECAKCCGADTQAADPSPCPPGTSGIYPNAGTSHIFLSVEWEGFSPAVAGYFDLPKMLLERYSNHTSEVDEFRVYEYYAGTGMPANLTVSHRSLSLSPFTLQLPLSPSPPPELVTDCLFTNSVSTPSLASVANVSEARTEVEAAGYLHVQSEVIPDFDRSGSYLKFHPLDFPQANQPWTDSFVGNGANAPQPYTWFTYSHSFRFHDAYAHATVDLSDDTPTMLVRLYVIVEESLLVTEYDYYSVATGQTYSFAGFSFREFFTLQADAGTNETPAFRVNYNCADFPVFIGQSDNAFFPVNKFLPSTFFSETFDSIRGIWPEQGMCQLGLSPIGESKVIHLLPGDTGFYIAEGTDQQASNWPAGWVRPHPEHEDAQIGNYTSRDFITVLDGGFAGGAMLPTESYEDEFGATVYHGDCIVDSDAEQILHINGFRNLRANVFPAGAF